MPRSYQKPRAHSVDEITAVCAWLPAAMLEHVVSVTGDVPIVDNGSSNDDLGDVSDLYSDSLFGEPSCSTAYILECEMDMDDDKRVQGMLALPSLEPEGSHVALLHSQDHGKIVPSCTVWSLSHMCCSEIIEITSSPETEGIHVFS